MWYAPVGDADRAADGGGARKIAKELKQGKKTKARLFVKLSDEARNTKKKLSVKLKR
jgi:hypothetical protein